MVHLAYHHSAFDDRIFYKEASSLSSRYRTIILIQSADGLVRDMGRNPFPQGVYRNIEVYAYTVPRSNGFFAKAIRFTLRKLGVRDRIRYSAVLARLDELGIVPAVVHIHEPELLALVGHIKRRYSSKVVFDSHEYSYAYIQRADFDRPGYLESAGRSLRKLAIRTRSCDGFIAVSRTMAAVSWFLSPQKPVSIIRNSTLISRHRTSKVGGRVTLVHEGSLAFSRGLRLMIDMSREPWIAQNARLRIIGAVNPAEQAFIDAAIEADSRVRDFLEFTGWVPYELLPERLEGDIGVILMDPFPNNYLGMPNKLFNYIGAGMPVISVPLLEIGDTIKSLGIGLVAERRPDSIAAAVREIASNYDSYAARVEAARDHMSWKRDEAELFKFYDSIME